MQATYAIGTLTLLWLHGPTAIAAFGPGAESDGVEVVAVWPSEDAFFEANTGEVAGRLQRLYGGSAFTGQPVFKVQLGDEAVTEAHGDAVRSGDSEIHQFTGFEVDVLGGGNGDAHKKG